MKIQKDDEVSDVCILNGNSNILVITEKGNITYFNENQITQTGLKTSGVKAISTLKNSQIKAVLSFTDNEKSKILLVTDKKMYRIYENTSAFLTDRLGKTQVAFKSFKSDVHSLVYAQKILNKDQPIKLYCLMDDKTVQSYDMNDYYLTPVDKYCKANIELESKENINSIYINSIDVIDSSFKSEMPLVSKNDNDIDPGFSVEHEDIENDNDAKKDDNYQQISIFDDMGD